MSVKLSPSLLSADFASLGAAARACADAGAEYLHFDVMDGQFVPNLTFGVPVVEAVRWHTSAVLDVHLMMVQPERLIEPLAAAGAGIITVQVEACTHAQRILAQVRAAGVRAGLALNPATPLSSLEYLLDDVDLLLIMSVNPGFGGQSFIPSALRKVHDAATLLRKAGCRAEIEVDGGIGPSNVRALADAGCTVVVAGSSIFGHPQGVAGGVRALREALIAS
ncbi:MAG TPA: ribulose-phosphate 3-epimerase [Chthonomonadales bacterium]|nr:ribulose-phosphate 3-epimerase [Chthonomonadales bacterium]